MLAREITPAQALAEGTLTVSGEPSATDILGTVFALDPSPTRSLAGLDSER